MKVIFLDRFKALDGAERQLIGLAKGLHARGHAVTLIAFYQPVEFETELAGSGLNVVSLEKKHRWDVFGFLFRLVIALRRERADIVHGYLGLANALLVLICPLHRAKVVWGARASDIDISRYDRLARFDAWLEAFLSRFPKLIIANSHSGKRHAIARGFPERKIVVIPNGIDLDRFRRDESGRERVRKEWGVGPDDLLIGRVGRIDPQKDYPTFIRSAAIVAASSPNARFVIVGGDRFGKVDELKALAAAENLADRMIWAGSRIDIAAVYSAFDLCVSSSAYGEGTPNVLAEAMACGVQCVTTDVGDSAITVGDLGLVVPRSDPFSLATAILTALDRDPDRAALRDHVARNLSMDQLVDRSELALKSIGSGAEVPRVLIEAPL